MRSEQTKTVHIELPSEACEVWVYRLFRNLQILLTLNVTHIMKARTACL
jgi:hypothetical protein